MNYYRETGQVEYRSKDGKETKVKNLKREDGLLISKIYYFQPILANRWCGHYNLHSV